MKKFFKTLLCLMMIVSCAFVFFACQEKDNDDTRIVSIVQTGYNDTSAEYLITYKDGETMTFTIPINNAVSISSIEKTSSNKNKDVYTITLSNGQTSNFEVTNGVSVESIKYARSEGLKDYYTITYSNGTTSEYCVTNGKDGADGPTLEELYEEAKKTKDYNSISEFIEEYLSININNNTTQIATGKAVLSAVSIYAQSNQGSWTNKNDFNKYVKAKGISAGAGVIYQLNKENGDAYIITNCHVVYEESTQSYLDTLYCFLYGMEGETPYSVVYNDDKTDYLYDDDDCVKIEFNQYAIPCTVIGASISYDVAVLKVENSETLKNSNARQIEVANSDYVSLGETAIAIGNPNMGGISATVGVISVISEYIQVSIDSDVATYLREFRIDTAVNGGNSGGGLFNSNGEWIGVVNAKTSDTSLENMGYAVPSNVMKNLADNIINNYENDVYFGVKKVQLGIALNAVSSSSIYDVDRQTTKIVEVIAVGKVNPDSTAEKMGFVAGDIIKKVTIVHNEDITILEPERYFQVIDLLVTARVGDTVKFDIETADGTNTLVYTLLETDFIEVK